MRVREAIGGEEGTERCDGLTTSMIGWSAKGSSASVVNAVRCCRDGGGGAGLRRGAEAVRNGRVEPVRAAGLKKLAALPWELTETFGSLVNDDACADEREELATKAEPKGP